MFLQTSFFNGQIGNGLILMVLGMGIVFLFLTILVFSTKMISKIVSKIEKKEPVLKSVEVKNNSESEVAAAIAVAFAESKL